MKVVIVVEGGCVVAVQADSACCEVEVIDMDAQDLAVHEAARARNAEFENDPAWFAVF